jgi:hypothetical protein
MIWCFSESASDAVAKHAVASTGIKQRLTDSTYLFILPSLDAGIRRPSLNAGS